MVRQCTYFRITRCSAAIPAVTITINGIAHKNNDQQNAAKRPIVNTPTRDSGSKTMDINRDSVGRNTRCSHHQCTDIRCTCNTNSRHHNSHRHHILRLTTNRCNLSHRPLSNLARADQATASIPGTARRWWYVPRQRVVRYAPTLSKESIGTKTRRTDAASFITVVYAILSIIIQETVTRQIANSFNDTPFVSISLCLPLLMLSNGAFVMFVDSEQSLSVGLCVESGSLLQHTPFLNAHWSSPPGTTGRISLFAPSTLLSRRLCLSQCSYRPVPFPYFGNANVLFLILFLSDCVAV